MNTVIIGIGSNIDAETNIQKTLVLLRQLVKVEKLSQLIQTKAVGSIKQPDFTNGAARITTTMDIHTLKKALQKLENEIGRDRTQPKFGPRCIDLDIIVWNGKIVDDDYFSRDFLKKSVDEVMPG
ncbi:MAG: 2-amino-4-hydroxy-6-hydroxymethyldihydropteridine diphosphokinase [Draconibacterium sp.]|nr:MAG: 2-amino-4-hydroxy-6-hydroxymethyldihydropteridine diphosphokinase [Draconibacterium sp.]